MNRAALPFVFFLVACGAPPKAEDPAPGPPQPPTPTAGPIATASPPPPPPANPTSTKAAKTEELPDEPKSIEPYKVGVTLNPATASTKEDVTVTWSIDGGTRAKSVKAFAQVKVEWTEIQKPGTKRLPPKLETFPAVANICMTSAPQEKITFPMQPKKNGAITVEVVACKGGAALEGSKGIGQSSVAWVSPYVSNIDVPTILPAGAPGQGKIEFKGIDGPKAEGAPPKVWISSNNPGITITKQPKVEASSPFEFTVKPDVSGDVKFTANHVNTDGLGKLLGNSTKTTTVRVKPK